MKSYEQCILLLPTIVSMCNYADYSWSQVEFDVSYRKGAL